MGKRDAWRSEEESEQGLRRSGRKGRDDVGQRLHAGLNADPATLAESATPGICTLRAVIDSAEDVTHAQARSVRSLTSEDADSTRRGSSQTSGSVPSRAWAQGNLYLHPTESQSVPASSESWQAHLSHDMALHEDPRSTSSETLLCQSLKLRLSNDVCKERHGPELRRRNSSAATLNRTSCPGHHHCYLQRVMIPRFRLGITSVPSW